MDIGDLLDTASLAAASMSCKRLHANLSHSWRNLRLISLPRCERQPLEKGRLDFLRRLARDDPRYYLCLFCRKLKPLSTYIPLSNRQDIVFSNCTCQAIEWNLMWNIDIDFHDAYLAIDNHFYRTGLPLSTLAYSSPWKPCPTNKTSPNLIPVGNNKNNILHEHWFRKVDTTPHIHEDQLILNVQRRQWFHPTTRTALRARKPGIGAHTFGICTHLCLPWTKPDVPTSIHAVLKSIPRRPVRPTKSCSRMRGCGYCPTNYTITVFDHVRLGVEVVVDSWHNLGFCRELDDLCGAQVPPEILPALAFAWTATPVLKVRDPGLVELRYPREMLGLLNTALTRTGVEDVTAEYVVRSWGIEGRVLEERRRMLTCPVDAR